MLKTLRQKIREKIAAQERPLSLLAFALGFMWDTLTLQRVDRLLDNLILASYLLLACASLLFIHAYRAGRLPEGMGRRGIGFFQFLLPFMFGGLFSGFLIFYSRSGALFSNAPFLIMLAVLLAGNEFFHRRYHGFTFQLSIFFIALFSYSALIVPVLLRRMGDAVFLLSGVAALCLFALFLALLARVAPEAYMSGRRLLLLVIALIYFGFNFLYFNNMIPPIPLSLKEIGAYHGVVRTEQGEYLLLYERAPWYALGQRTSSVFNRARNEPVYVFSSVFAPTDLTTEIRHRWSYRDPHRQEWVPATVVRFPISGGRDKGFRGYSVKENLKAGKWRVDAETLRGQVIGRLDLEVRNVSTTPPTVTSMR
ncbi:MAG: hypothetical protein Greene041679_173 [Parcubacteria group bacterium Greene0416_79]|nr:MAG: hypothetical protein Greene041679_173 [Parcubacteria group bacterium Greene0416_79]